MIDWFRNVFCPKKVDILANRVVDLYKNLKYLYLKSSDINYNQDFKVMWKVLNQTEKESIGMVELHFNSLLCPIVLNILLEERYGKDSDAFYTLTYTSTDIGEGFTILVQDKKVTYIDNDFTDDEIDLAIFEVEEYLQQELKDMEFIRG